MESYSKLLCWYFVAFSLQMIHSQYQYFDYDLIKNKISLKLTSKNSMSSEIRNFGENSISLDDD